jgi:hypothetical protein
MHHKKTFAILLLLTAGLLGSCRRDLNPPQHHVSDEKLESVKIGASMQEVRRTLGAPSFIWPASVFEPPHYPHSRACAATRPTQMWIYDERNAESATVFFNAAGRVVCHERALMIIAY